MWGKYKYPYLSIDHLKMGLIRSGNTKLTPVSDETELTAYLWPIVREMISKKRQLKINKILSSRDAIFRLIGKKKTFYNRISPFEKGVDKIL